MCPYPWKVLSSLSAAVGFVMTRKAPLDLNKLYVWLAQYTLQDFEYRKTRIANNNKHRESLSCLPLSHNAFLQYTTKVEQFSVVHEDI